MKNLLNLIKEHKLNLIYNYKADQIVEKLSFEEICV